MEDLKKICLKAIFLDTELMKEIFESETDKASLVLINKKAIVFKNKSTKEKIDEEYFISIKDDETVKILFWKNLTPWEFSEVAYFLPYELLFINSLISKEVLEQIYKSLGIEDVINDIDEIIEIKKYIVTNERGSVSDSFDNLLDAMNYVEEDFEMNFDRDPTEEEIIKAINKTRKGSVPVNINNIFKGTLRSIIKNS